MKTLDVVVAGYSQQTMDGRDVARLAMFLTEAQLEQVGVTLKPEYVGKHVPEPWTEEKVMAQVTTDLAFSFTKALDKRGISAACMYEVMRMWDWVLTDGEEVFRHVTRADNYTWYGLPLFKALALKYNLPNPIGDDSGTEDKYSDMYVDADNT
jgi:hypothetical protein